MADVYTFGTDTAYIQTPDATWLLTGSSDLQPYPIELYNWVLATTISEVARATDHISGDSETGLLADTVMAQTNWATGNVSGAYFTVDGATAGATGHALQFRARGRTINFLVEDYLGNDVFDCTIKKDGNWEFTTGSLKGLRAATDANFNHIRYGYASTYPTFTWDLSPYRGYGHVEDATEIVATHKRTDGYTAIKALSGGPVTGRYVVPIFLPDNNETTGTLYELMSLNCAFTASGGSGRTMTVEVIRSNLTGFGSPTAIMTLSGDETTPLTVQTITTGAPIVMDPTTYLYEIYIECSGVTTSHTAIVQRLYIDVRKRGVE